MLGRQGYKQPDRARYRGLAALQHIEAVLGVALALKVKQGAAGLGLLQKERVHGVAGQGIIVDGGRPVHQHQLPPGG